MKQITITSSKQAEKYKFLPFNRGYKVRHDLINKMNKYGFTVPIIIIKTNLISGKDEYFIADGQHRTVTALFLNKPITAQILSIEFNSIPEIVEFVASLNATHKSWVVQDYVDAFAYLKYDNYITLNKVVTSCPFSVTTIASMLSGFRSKAATPIKVKEGTFVCNLLDETKTTLVFTAKLSKIGKLTSRMVLALHYVMHSSNSFNEELFTKKYKEQYECIKELKLDDYTDVFASWLN